MLVMHWKTLRDAGPEAPKLFRLEAQMVRKAACRPLKIYREPRKRRMRSRPRFSSAIEVAYEIRMWSVVPKPSPGTVATCASRRSLPAKSAAELTPPRPKKAETFGYA